MFGKEVEEFALQFQDASEKTVRATTIKLWNSITLSSPVDQGRFRANWFASYGDTEKVTNDTDKSGQKTISRNENDVLNQSKWDRFTLTNNLPYSLVLEYGRYPKPPKKGTYLGKGKGYEIRSQGGYSKQAVGGMVRINVKRFKRLIEQEAKKNMPK